MATDILRAMRADLQASSSGNRAAIGAAYVGIVGYDCFADSPDMTTEEGAELLRDFLREECSQRGIHWLDVCPAVVFTFDGGADMLAANADDSGLCEWLRAARSGDTFHAIAGTVVAI